MVWKPSVIRRSRLTLSNPADHTHRSDCRRLADTAKSIRECTCASLPAYTSSHCSFWLKKSLRVSKYVLYASCARKKDAKIILADSFPHLYSRVLASCTWGRKGKCG